MLSVLPESFESRNQELGSKTIRLHELSRQGFSVPPFMAIPQSTVKKIYLSQKNSNDKILSQVVEEIIKHLPAESYAVRSSALVEDNTQESYAGQFLTHVDKKQFELKEAITRIITDATAKLRDPDLPISVIIQEYIAADFSGITFTRNPLGSREMVIEYHQGIGEEIVSGKIKPQRVSYLWNQPPLKEPLPNLLKTIHDFKKIELYFNFPQDIEWCIKDNQWYLLQSRPITSVSPQDYKDFLYLDAVLPNGNFLYEKTEISEIAPRPTSVTLSLIKLIYAPEGPVAKTYQQYGIQYHAGDVLKIIGNELYVDREAELKTLLPAYTYFARKPLTPQLSQLTGLMRSMRNIRSLGRLKATPHKFIELLQRLQQALNHRPATSTLTDALENFLKDYQLIFEINLLAGQALNKLTQTVKDQEKISWILAAELSDKKPFSRPILTEKILGNSLEIADQTPFFRNENIASHTRANEWWKNVAAKDKNAFSAIGLAAQNYSELREYARWLTVKNVNYIRSQLDSIAATKEFTDIQAIYHASLEDIIANRFTESECLHQKKEFEKHSSHTFPARLTNILETIHDKKPVGISHGTATGTLVNQETLTSIKGSKILYATTLSPDLTQHFDSITGIISEQGGLLSHLAIVAREKKIPVVTNANLKILSLKLGDSLTIDGGAGSIKKTQTH